MNVSTRRSTALAALVILPLAAWASTRPSFLRSVGSILVANEAGAVGRADVIVVAIAADGAGVLEAADLYERGIASRVAVFADPPQPIDLEFLRRGVPYEDEAARSTRQLHSLGVTHVETIPDQPPAGTEAEAGIIPKWCDRNRFDSIVLVTTRDHSRRVSRMLRRTMSGHLTRVVVKPSRYSPFDPDRWWDDRGSERILIIELQKLLWDVVRHPLT